MSNFEFTCDIKHIEYGNVPIWVEAFVVDWGSPGNWVDPPESGEWDVESLGLNVDDDHPSYGAEISLKSITQENWASIQAAGDEAFMDLVPPTSHADDYDPED